MLGFGPIADRPIADPRTSAFAGTVVGVWTIPLTWTNETDIPGDEIASPNADFNTEIRDHLNVLKTPLNDAGKIPALSLTYFRNVNASEITGIAHGTNVPNSFTGTNRFDSGNGRVVLPVFASPGPSGAGQIFLSDDGFVEWHSEADEWRSPGRTPVDVQSPGRTGSIWIEGENLHWCAPGPGQPDLFGFVTEYIAAGLAVIESPSPGVPGSIWVEGEFLHFVSQGGVEYRVFGTD